MSDKYNQRIGFGYNTNFFRVRKNVLFLTGTLIIFSYASGNVYLVVRIFILINIKLITDGLFKKVYKYFY